MGIVSSMASTSSSSYNEEEKVECRLTVINHAVQSLTTERPTSACVLQSDVAQFWEKLKKNEEVLKYSFLSAKEIADVTKEVDQWKRFSDSQIQSKKPSDLRVCYLCGNNPLNDLKIFVDNGVLCQNVWAIEKDKNTLKEALESIKDSNLRNVNLFKGNILGFLKEFEGQFDIIYYDSTGTLPSLKQETCKVIGYVFLYNKLTSPGALITNFSFPPKLEISNTDEKTERNNINMLTQEYLKNRLSNTTFITRSESIEKFLERTEEENYSDYITYQVIDSAFLMVPALRMLSSNARSALWDQILKSKKDFLNEVKSYEGDGPPPDSSDSSALKMKRHCKSHAKESYIKKIGSGLRSLAQSNRFCTAWVKEIFPDRTNLLKDYDISSLLLTHLLCTSQLFIKRFFKDDCLEPLFHYLHEKPGKTTPYNNVCLLVAGLLYGQLAYPSFPVLSKLLRLQYTAKKRQMFCDVIIFDKCRYMYEQFPTVDCAYFALNEQKQRVVICMVVAFLRKHLEHVCQDVFHGCDFATLYPRMSGPCGVSFPNIPQYSLGERVVRVRRPGVLCLWPFRAMIFFLIFFLICLFFQDFFVYFISFIFYFISFLLVFSFILFYFLFQL